ncbi:MAG TPA: metalloregulator ArsR/SmtB family transcription factor [Kofleriaceae bacterium]|nr:metalloregulator ArsR/SmtB family transcription factor [Kofleriaceae bacterium]
MSRNLDATFAALADPTRRAMLARLAEGEVSVTDLAAPFDMSLAAVSKHLKVLERAGLIIRGREAQWRPCRLDARPLQEVATYLERYRRFWEDSFDRLDDYLKTLQQQDGRQDETHERTKDGDHERSHERTKDRSKHRRSNERRDDRRSNERRSHERKK